MALERTNQNEGSGIFISPGGVLANSGSVGAGLIVWVVSGLIAFLGTLDYLELVCKINLLKEDQSSKSRF